MKSKVPMNTPMNVPPGEHDDGDDALDALLRWAATGTEDDSADEAAFVAAVMQRVRHAAAPLRADQALRQIERLRASESKQRRWAMAGALAGVALFAWAFSMVNDSAVWESFAAAAAGDAGPSALVGVTAALAVLVAWALQQVPRDG